MTPRGRHFSTLRLFHALCAVLILAATLAGATRAGATPSNGDDAPQPAGAQTVFVPLVSGGAQDGPPDFSYTIDPAVQPSRASLPGLGDPAPRPLAAIADPGGRVATFVANEVILQTDDPAQLDAIVRRYNGQVLFEVNAAAQGVPNLPRTYLIRVDNAVAPIDRLVDATSRLGGGADSRASGLHRISSDAGARLLSIAAVEKAGGLPVGVNWLGEPDAIPDSSAEAPNGPSLGGPAYSPNVYGWAHMARGTVQDIGVPQAWSLLFRSGRIANRVWIAILDKGFAPHADFPAAVTFISVIPGIADPRGVRGDADAPWHGTNVFETAMARHDNGFGVAGTAAPVGQPILVYTGYDYITSIGAVIAARAAGAKVLNMSYSANVPAAFAWTAAPFELTTLAVRGSGALLFASAGNDDTNVDATDCFIICWEETLHTPCENAGVICVGGLGWNSKSKSGGSNYGEGGVHIFAPYTTYAGPDPDSPGAGATARSINGTSFSSPYTAGVAALIWAASPSLSADQVWEIMRATAHSSPDGRVPRYVNAYGALLRAIGSAAAVDIVTPGAGATFELNNRIELLANVGYVAERDGVPLTVQWRSEPGGRLLGTESFSPGAGSRTIASRVFVSDLAAGAHTITVRATAGSVTAEDTVSISVRNSPPVVEIAQPTAGAMFCPGETITLRGSATDINELGGLPAGAYRWSSSRDGILGTGATLSTSALSVGAHTITLRATDGGGLFAEDTVAIGVRGASDPACTDLPPSALITSPANGTTIWAEAEDAGGWYATATLVGMVDDVEDASAALSAEWRSDIDGVLGAPAVSAAGRTEVTVRLHVRPADVGTGGSQHSITLRVTDSDGNVTEDTISVRIATLI